MADRKWQTAFQVFKSFFASWALMKAGRMEPGNIFTLFFFILTFLFFRYVQQKKSLLQDKDQRMSTTSYVLAVIYTLCYMLMNTSAYVETLTNRLFRLTVLAAVAIGFFFLFEGLLSCFFTIIKDKAKLSQIFCENEHTDNRNPFRKHPFLCTFVICLLGWLPYYLYQFPGIMTPDSINQMEQVLGLIPYSNHHPWVHTMLIKAFYTLGYALTGNMVTAVGFYTFAQMSILALSISYFISAMRMLKLKPFWCMILSLLFALLPYHAVYSVTVWKDIPFAAAVLLFMTALLRMKHERQLRHSVIFVIAGIMMCLFRSNGWYAFLVCIPFLFIYYWKHDKKVIGLLACSLFTAILVRYPVMNNFQVTPPDFVESLCIPIQQISNVLVNDRTLTAEQNALIDHVIDRSYVKELYNPTFADNMKELVRAGHPEYLETHKKEYLRLWLQLLIQYPADYLEAYIQQTNGYWYPDSYYPVAEAEGISLTTLGISHTPLIRGPIVVKAKEIAIKLGSMIPVYGTLWSMGVAFWVLLLAMGSVWIRRENKKLLYLLPCIMLWLSVMIATPVATEFRYVYFLILCEPFFLCMMLLPEPQNSIFE